jgi:hypothetical protein
MDKCVDKWNANLWRNKCHADFASSNISMSQMCFQCTIFECETYELWLNEFYTILITKSWDVKFVMHAWLNLINYDIYVAFQLHNMTTFSQLCYLCDLIDVTWMQKLIIFILIFILSFLKVVWFELHILITITHWSNMPHLFNLPIELLKKVVATQKMWLKIKKVVLQPCPNLCTTNLCNNSIAWKWKSYDTKSCITYLCRGW